MRSCPVCRNRFPTGANFCPHDGQGLLDAPGETHPEDDRFVGTTLDGRYEVLTRIGQGGMGVVYSARHIVIDKPVAIKVLRAEYCRKPGLVERFIREARAASRIGHPNIVDVTDFGKLADEQVFLVMEHLVGSTLAGEIRRLDQRIERMPMSRVLDLSTQICHGLAAAHEKGIVHRDLKPENIFVVNPRNDTVIADQSGYRTDFVKLLDFGIARFTVESARITQMGSVFGTPQYMAPEQAAGQDADHRGDIYALGCIVYEMVAGRPPFMADTFMGTLTKQMYEPPVSPRQVRLDGSIPPPLEAAILRMLAKRPEDRFQSTREVATALGRCFSKRPAVVAPPEATDPPGPTKRVSVGPPSAAAPPSGRPGRQPASPLGHAGRPQREVTTHAVDRRSLVALVALALSCVALAVVLARGGGRWGEDSAQGLAGGGADGAAGGIRVAGSTDAGGTAPDSGRGRAPDEDRPVAKTVSVRVETIPAGAAIWVEGRLMGTAPRELELTAARSHQLVLRKPGYRSRHVTFLPAEHNGAPLVFKLIKTGKTRSGADRVLLGDEPPRPADLRSPFGGQR